MCGWRWTIGHLIHLFVDGRWSIKGGMGKLVCPCSTVDEKTRVS